jgi:hypothetical protein
MGKMEICSNFDNSATGSANVAQYLAVSESGQIEISRLGVFERGSNEVTDILGH